MDAPALPITLTFAGLAGEGRTPAEPSVLPAEAGHALGAFFEAHPAAAALGFELALNEDGSDIEFAGGVLLDVHGQPLAGREGERAATALRRLLGADPHLAALPVALTVAHGGIDAAFRIAREATGATPAVPPAERSADAARRAAGDDARAAARTRARLAEQDARWDQRDALPDRWDGVDAP